MGETPMSALTLLCSGIQLYSAEQRIADCILADVKWAASATSAELARQSQASEATVTRLCHKLGFESYRKFQLALARDVMEQQEAEKSHAAAQPDRMRSILQKFLVNKQEEVRATVQALDADQLRAALACLNAAHVVEVAAASHNLSIALEASVKFGSLGKAVRGQCHPGKDPCLCGDFDKERPAAGHLRHRAEPCAGRGGPAGPGKRGSHPPHHKRPALAAGPAGGSCPAGFQPGAAPH